MAIGKITLGGWGGGGGGGGGGGDGWWVGGWGGGVFLVVKSLVSLWLSFISSNFALSYRVILYSPCKWIQGLFLQWYVKSGVVLYGFSVRKTTFNLINQSISDTASHYFNGLMQKRHNSNANALELRLSCTNTLIYNHNSLPVICKALPLLPASRDRGWF